MLNYTEIVMIMDRSGSMHPLCSDAIGGFNAFVGDQLKCAGKAKLTLIQFSSDYEVIYDNVPLSDVKPLTPETYRPCGSTAMLDTLIYAIDKVGYRLQNTPEEERPDKVIFVIITDGQENASQKYPAPAGYQVCKDKVDLQTDVYNWDFIFLAADKDAVLIGSNTYTGCYTSNSVGTQSVYRSSSLAVQCLRQGSDQESILNALASAK